MTYKYIIQVWLLLISHVSHYCRGSGVEEEHDNKFTATIANQKYFIIKYIIAFSVQPPPPLQQ